MQHESGSRQANWKISIILRTSATGRQVSGAQGTALRDKKSAKVLRGDKLYKLRSAHVPLFGDGPVLLDIES